MTGDLNVRLFRRLVHYLNRQTTDRLAASFPRHFGTLVPKRKDHSRCSSCHPTNNVNALRHVVGAVTDIGALPVNKLQIMEIIYNHKTAAARFRIPHLAILRTAYDTSLAITDDLLHCDWLDGLG